MRTPSLGIYLSSNCQSLQFDTTSSVVWSCVPCQFHRMDFAVATSLPTQGELAPLPEMQEYQPENLRCHDFKSKTSKDSTALKRNASVKPTKEGPNKLFRRLALMDETEEARSREREAGN